MFLSRREKMVSLPNIKWHWQGFKWRMIHMEATMCNIVTRRSFDNKYHDALHFITWLDKNPLLA